MTEVKINLLGGVSISRDGVEVRLGRQALITLAILVAQHDSPVRTDVIADSLWPRVPVDSRPKGGTATVIKLARKALEGSGLVVRDGRTAHQYQLDGCATDADSPVDAFRFEAFVARGSRLLDAGQEDRALEQFMKASTEWHGEPFDSSWLENSDIELPGGCDKLARRLNAARDNLVRLTARIALRRGTSYDDARIFTESPVGDGTERLPEVWLLNMLDNLRQGRGDAASALLAVRARDAAGDDIRWRARDLYMLSTFAKVRVHDPLTVTPGEPRGTSPRELVGREGELNEFEALLAAVRSGHPATMMVHGDTGSGKTRLAEEFAARATAAGMPVILTDKRKHGDLQQWQYLAGALWANWCRDIGAGGDPLAGEQHRLLEQFVAMEDSGGPDDQAPERRHATLVEGLQTLCRRVAGKRGLIVVFDDAEFLSRKAGYSTGQGEVLLREVRAGLAGAPVGWILIGRPYGRWHDQPPLGPAEERYQIPLEPLPVDAVRQWITLTAGREPTQEEVIAAWERTGGLPLSLSLDLGRRKPMAMGSASRRSPVFMWIAAAAITAMGLDIDTALVRAMLRLDSTRANLLQAAAAGIWGVDPGARFSHKSERDKVIDELRREPDLERDMHRRAFEELTAAAGSSPDGEQARRIAHHARSSGREVPEQDRARAFLAAARAEHAAHSYEAAETWARSGIDLRDDVGRDLRSGLHLALGDTLNDRGAGHDADEQYELAYDIALGHPREQARAAIRLARRWSGPGRIGEERRMLRASLDGLAGADDLTATELRLQLMAHLARKSTFAVPVPDAEPDATPGEGAALALRALERLQSLEAQRPGALDREVLCEVVDVSRWAVYDHHPPTQTIMLSRQLKRESDAARSPYFQSEALMALAIDQLRLGQVTDARANAAWHAETADRSFQATWLQATMDTLFDLWEARFDRAGQRITGAAQRMINQARDEGSGSTDTLMQTQTGQMYWLLRERGEIHKLVQGQVGDEARSHSYFPIWPAAMILACCDLGQFDAATGMLDKLARDTRDFGTLPEHGWTPSVLALLAEACLELALAPGSPRPHPLTGRLRALMRRHHGRFVLAGWPTVLLGPAERFSGLLATADGDYDAALDLFRTAADAVKDAYPQATRLRLDQGRALVLRDGPTPAAVEMLSKTRADAENLGMIHVANEAGRTLLQPPPRPR